MLLLHCFLTLYYLSLYFRTSYSFDFSVTAELHALQEEFRLSGRQCDLHRHVH